MRGRRTPKQRQEAREHTQRTTEVAALRKGLGRGIELCLDFLATFEIFEATLKNDPKRALNTLARGLFSLIEEYGDGTRGPNDVIRVEKVSQAPAPVPTPEASDESPKP